MNIWEQIAELVSNNLDLISLGTLVTVISGAFSYFLFKKVIPNVLNRGLLYLSQVMAKMFGQDVDEVSATIKQLPFVEKISSWEHEMHVQNELKLIELKNKIVSPKLSDTERIAYQAMFDQVMRQLGQSVSSATIMALDAIEAAAKKKLG